MTMSDGEKENRDIPDNGEPLRRNFKGLTKAERKKRRNAIKLKSGTEKEGPQRKQVEEPLMTSSYHSSAETKIFCSTLLRM